MHIFIRFPIRTCLTYLFANVLSVVEIFFKISLKKNGCIDDFSTFVV
jgi:hypothetical protein